MSRKPINPDANYFKQMAQAEKSILAFTLNNAENIAHAARILGITESYLHKRLEKTGLKESKKKRIIEFPVRVLPSIEPIKVPNPVVMKLKEYVPPSNKYLEEENEEDELDLSILPLKDA